MSVLQVIDCWAPFSVQMAADMGVPFLGRVPLDPSLGRAAEEGRSAFADGIATLPSTPALHAVVQRLLAAIGEAPGANACAPIGACADGKGSAGSGLGPGDAGEGAGGAVSGTAPTLGDTTHLGPGLGTGRAADGAGRPLDFPKTQLRANGAPA